MANKFNAESLPNTSDISRRQALSQLTTLTAATPLAFWSTSSITEAQKQYEPLNRYPRMVHNYFVRKVRLAGQISKQRIEKLTTREEAEAFVKATQKRIHESFGKQPEKTPLNPRVTNTVERDEYTIENVIFESRPGFPVTANVYIPKNKKGPFPAVVGTCGHSSNGKAAGAYQSFAQGLARLGYICLIYDPIGQGERLQYPNEELKSEIGVGVQEHLHAGNQQFLVGEFIGSWRAWDGIRAVDYLLTRDDVDKKQVGVTGNSGGGTMTTWLTGVEDRWSMSAPSCFVTTFRRNIENELPADTEQCPPKVLALGLDHCDFLAAMAPKPVIILAKEQDFFDVRGSFEAYSRLKHLYKLLGAEENVAIFAGPTPHGFSQENREAMYSWFNRATGQTADAPEDHEKFDGVLKTAADLAFTPEPEIVLEKDETLWCTPQGQVATLEGTRTIFNFTSEASQKLASKRKGLKGEALQESVRNVLNLPKQPNKTPDFTIYRGIGSRGYPTKSSTAYAVKTEPGIQAIVYRLLNSRLSSRPPQGGTRATLYVSHLSSDAELRNEELIADLIKAEPDTPFFTCDVRGIGESMPDTCSSNAFHSSYGSDYMYSIHSLMLDRPYIGQKTFDILRVLDWMKQFGHTEVHIVGNGWGALPATFAALLSDQVTQVTLKNALTSYSELAETEHYEWPLSTLLPNVLSEFDMPDCYAALEGKQLKQIAPWGAEEAGH